MDKIYISAKEALQITQNASMLAAASAAIRNAALHARGSIRFDLTQRDIQSLKNFGFKVNPMFKLTNGAYRTIITWCEE